jgi:transcriptional regulator with XRE-family HTH domain
MAADSLLPNGRLIRDARKSRLWTPDDLARRARVSVSIVKKAELGKQRVRWPFLANIASALEKSLPEIVIPDQQGSGIPALAPPLSGSPASRDWAELTYYRYRSEPRARARWPDLVNHLELRYDCAAMRLWGRPFPATALWQNAGEIVLPDAVLGTLDPTPPIPLAQSPVLPAELYPSARAFIKEYYEAGPIKYEGADYRMTRVETVGGAPRIHGALGLYYDAILTQYAMEWELNKALAVRAASDNLKALFEAGTLPLREAVEQSGNPMTSGNGRCAALAISTLVVFKRRKRDDFFCLAHRRSDSVGVSPSMFCVVPAGMFEQKNADDPWSVESTVWRELLEEVYDDTEHQGTGAQEIEDYLYGKQPIALLTKLLAEGRAEFSVTGIICDLLALRPEICTVLFIPDPSFSESRKMTLNWEYGGFGSGTGVVRWADMEQQIRGVWDQGMDVGSAACMKFGRDWIGARHGL